jgi:hypothetical protein
MTQDNNSMYVLLQPKEKLKEAEDKMDNCNSLGEFQLSYIR